MRSNSKYTVTVDTGATVHRFNFDILADAREVYLSNKQYTYPGRSVTLSRGDETLEHYAPPGDEGWCEYSTSDRSDP